jgi:four helix bundle protein
MEYKGYGDLLCYREARLLRIFISGLTKNFPVDEKFLLTKQIIDSSRSITRNIAEGYGRFTYSDTKNFFIIARGSTTETMEHLLTANDECYISEREWQAGQEKCELVFKLINGYINYLDKIKTRTKNDTNP